MYANWDYKMDIIANHFRWYRTADVISFAHRTCDFVINSVGRMSTVYAPNLTQSRCPAQLHLRFPENDLYICDGVGGWSYRINTMFLALSIVLHPTRLPRNYPEVDTPGDAEMALLATAAEVIGSIERLQDVIDRNTFEQRYEIQWTDLSSTRNAGAGGSGP